MKEEEEKTCDDDEVTVCQICGGTPCEWVEFGEESTQKDCIVLKI